MSRIITVPATFPLRLLQNGAMLLFLHLECIFLILHIIKVENLVHPFQPVTISAASRCLFSSVSEPLTAMSRPVLYT